MNFIYIQAMKERHQEIKIHKEMLTAQVKATDEERQQISAELHERIAKIDKLKKRYFLDIFVKKFQCLSLYIAYCKNYLRL